MSVQAITWAYAQETSAPLAKFLLVTIANYANERLEAWPSKSRLAADMGCSESSVCKHLQTLQDDKLVDVQPRFVDGVQIPSKITLLAYPHLGGVVRVAEGGGPSRGPGVVRHADTEPSIEPSNKKRTAHAREFFGVVDDGPEADVSFDGQTITLVNGERADWLKRFDGDDERLDLALAQAANFIQPNARKSLLVQVRAQLSRAVADKRDRDMRYAAAAKAKPTAQAKPFRVSRW
jgi:biotin operon repressor